MEDRRPFASAPKPLTPDSPCGLGQYKNVPLRSVPLTYFKWMRTVQRLYPRVDRGYRWAAVISYLDRYNILTPTHSK